MDKNRLVADVVIRDLDRARAVLNRLAQHVKEHHPSVLVWECYFDKAGRRMVWVQEHSNEPTLLAYETDVRGLDFMRKLTNVAHRPQRGRGRSSHLIK